MYYYVSGTVAVLEQYMAVIDCGGVGYACHTSQSSLNQLQMGKQAKLFTYLHVREDIFDLYGFATQEELSFFKQLIGVTGVGPKAALAILSIANPSHLALSIITGDEKLLTQAPGIGKKIAQRIVLELRDKMSKEQSQLAGGAVAAFEMPATKTGAVNQTQEAVAALMVLGYAQAEALRALEAIAPLEGMSAEDMIRGCLKKLAAM